MGYLNCKPGSRDYLQLKTKGKLKDIDNTDKNRCCLYIMYRGLIRVGYARISHGGVTDTEIQLAKFTIPDNHRNYKDNNYMTINPDDIDQSLHFPSVFGDHYGDEWVEEGHHYHKATPKYFTKTSKKGG
ncbi:PGAP2-interacting protein-like [Saccoglossus kowalevskii]|uniref:PGAP2-interacting protein-like n=1 Tax=Saccoglossus kowalevskii TaxID=10224 RepID=A0ABM0MUI5_SACKO|nr:PREDICTED: PGAP2-interacting protein-like [Saccoglossus kowalevskii]